MNLALFVTLLRIILAPAFVYILIASKGNQLPLLYAALATAIIMEASDAFDGWIARKWNIVTDLGKILDPLADSIARMSCFIAFFGLHLIPAWMLLVFLYRDSIISTLRIFAASKKLILAARTSGKLKAIIQAIAIFGGLLTLIAKQYQINLPATTDTLIYYFFIAAIIGTVYSLFDYLYGNRKLLKELVQ